MNRVYCKNFYNTYDVSLNIARLLPTEHVDGSSIYIGHCIEHTHAGGSILLEHEHSKYEKKTFNVLHGRCEAKGLVTLGYSKKWFVFWRHEEETGALVSSLYFIQSFAYREALIYYIKCICIVYNKCQYCS